MGWKPREYSRAIRRHDAGADDYFTKPFSLLALIQKVEEVLA